MKIIGISAYYHDAAAALVEDGRIIAAAQEERFTRKKHDPSFPSGAVSFCLSRAGGSFDNIDAVVFYDKPWLKFERLLQTYYIFAPRGLRSFIASMPVWIKEKIFLKEVIYDELSKMKGFDRDRVKLLFSEHHLSHAASAFYPSPFGESAILTVDGVGEWATASVCRGENEGIKVLKELKFPHSLGLFYTAFTYYLGFKVNSGEYKLMGLSPYGDPDSENFKRFKRAILEEIVDLKEDGSLFLNQEYFNYAAGLTMTDDRGWRKLFGLGRRVPESEILQEHCDLALAAQKITEEAVVRMAKTAKTLTGSKNLAIAGGVGLNCVANRRLLDEKIFENIWVQPAAGDAGGAVGAALAAYHIHYAKKREETGGFYDGMSGSYLGPEYSDFEIEEKAKKLGARYKRVQDYGELCGFVAERVARGGVVGWFRGRMEWGPRALGNRSILGDARNKDIQKRMNLKTKFRESFRPFAPSVLFEETGKYFEDTAPLPYMMFTSGVKKGRRNALPEDYNKLPIKDKLYFTRSDIPAVTHLDFSARLQTVHRQTNPDFWNLMEAFRKKTGCGVMVNTSFNVRGEPIVCSPEDAYRCFMKTDMDLLVMGNYVFDKGEQPKPDETADWKEDLVMD
ncbi:MAG: carbamoyltransferase [Endomicrobiales bacterium]|nr:carbamoyltransferase [Endomicrobiales bacterium]